MQGEPKAIPPAFTMDDVSALYDSALSTSASLMREKGFRPAPVFNLRTMDLGPCRHDMPDDGGTPLEDAVARVAFEMAYFRHSLRARLYRAVDYEPVIASYERRAVYALYHRFRNRDERVRLPDIQDLVARLDRMRAQRYPNHAALTYVAECPYSGTLPVIFRAVPESGRVWFISRFNFRLCEARGKDPWSRSQCTTWRESDNAIARPLFGELVYQARWPDGRAGKGDRTVQQGKVEGLRLVIRVRPDF